MDDYLSKPFEADALEEKINRWIDVGGPLASGTADTGDSIRANDDRAADDAGDDLSLTDKAA